jgi:hypothetical protein
MKKWKLCALVLTASLAGCSDRSGAEKAVREIMKDPGSAKFGEFYFNKKNKKGCMTVNGKNSMGGYTGNQQAYVQQTKNGWEALGIRDADPQTCREVFADYTG